MDHPVPSTLASNTVIGGSDDSMESNLPPMDDGIVLAQPTANPPITSSNPTIELIDVKNPSAQDKDIETLNDALIA